MAICAERLNKPNMAIVLSQFASSTTDVSYIEKLAAQAIEFSRDLGYVFYDYIYRMDILEILSDKFAKENQGIIESYINTKIKKFKNSFRTSKGDMNSQELLQLKFLRLIYRNNCLY